MGDMTQSPSNELGTTDNLMNECIESQQVTKHSEPVNGINVTKNCNENGSEGEACTNIIDNLCRSKLEFSPSSNVNEVSASLLCSQAESCADEGALSEGDDDITPPSTALHSTPLQPSTTEGNAVCNDNTDKQKTSSETDLNKNSMPISCCPNTDVEPFKGNQACEEGIGEMVAKGGDSNQDNKGSISSNKSSGLGIIDSVSKQFEKLCNKAFENQGKLLLLESKPPSSEIKERVMSYFTKTSSQDKENVLAEEQANVLVQSNNNEQPESSKLLFNPANTVLQAKTTDLKDAVTLFANHVHSIKHSLQPGQEAQGREPNCEKEEKSGGEVLEANTCSLREIYSDCDLNMKTDSFLEVKEDVPQLVAVESNKVLQHSSDRDEKSAKNVKVAFNPNSFFESPSPKCCSPVSDGKMGTKTQDLFNGALNAPSDKHCVFNGVNQLHTSVSKPFSADVRSGASLSSATPPVPPSHHSPPTNNNSSSDMWFKSIPNIWQPTGSTSQVYTNMFGYRDSSPFTAAGKPPINDGMNYLFQTPKPYNLPGQGHLWTYPSPAPPFGSGNETNAQEPAKVVTSSRSTLFGTSTTTTASINSPVFSFKFSTDKLSSGPSESSSQEPANTLFFTRTTTNPASPTPTTTPTNSTMSSANTTTVNITSGMWAADNKGWGCSTTSTAAVPACLSLFGRGSTACNASEAKGSPKETPSVPWLQKKWPKSQRRNGKFSSGPALSDTSTSSTSPQRNPKKANLQSPDAALNAIRKRYNEEAGFRSPVQTAFKFEPPGPIRSKSNSSIFSPYGSSTSAEQSAVFATNPLASLTRSAPTLSFSPAQVLSKNEIPAFAFASDHKVKPNASPFPSSIFSRVNCMSDLARGGSLAPNIPFKFVYGTDIGTSRGLLSRSGTPLVTTRLNSIVCMPEYENFSQEELRFIYYNTRPGSVTPDTFSDNAVSPDELKFTCSEQKSTTEPFLFSAKISASVFHSARRTKHKEVQTEEAALPSRQADLPEIWRVLECPVCLDVVLAPVYQCEQGHHVCNSCWPKVVTCPLCKRYKTGTRNYMAEALVEQVPLPCRYHIEGCRETVKNTSKLVHEERCMFRMYQCPAPVCNQAHSYDNMCKHFHKVHKDLLHNKDNSISKGEKFCDIVYKENLTALVHAFDIKEWGLFFLRQESASPAPGTALFMQVMPASSETTAYFYRLEICDHHDCRRECYKGRVFPMGKPTKDIVNQEEYLAVSQLLLKTVKKNTPLKITICIWQLKPAFSFKKE